MLVAVLVLLFVLLLAAALPALRRAALRRPLLGLPPPPVLSLGSPPLPLGLPPGLLQLPLPGLEQPPLGLLFSSGGKLRVQPLLLVLEGPLPDVGLELLRGLAGQDPGHLPKVRQGEPRQNREPLLRQEAGLNLDDEHVPLLQGRGRGQGLLGSAVVEVLDADVRVWPLARGPRPPEAAPCGPVDNLPVAKLAVVRVPLKE
mmetsp:Transcript_47674/g.136133  ORF Transcript_47674/g.136133 Transcript_47674/m.136133 type:complete len:201 (-) Transcript_47674:232-834(-)